MNVTASKHTDYRSNASQQNSFFNSMVFRTFVLLLLLGLLQIPVSLLKNHIDNDIEKRQKITNDIANQWGSPQTIIGPLLSIPYVERISRIETQTDSAGVKSSVSKDIFNNKTLILLPESLRINAKLTEKLLNKEQHKVPVYQGDIELSGNFNLDSLPEPSAYNTIEWDKAFIAIGLSDNSSVEASSPLRWEDGNAYLQPGTQLNNLFTHGLHATLEDVANTNPSPQFKVQLNLKGKDSFQFAPFGEVTSAQISSDVSNLENYGNITESSKVESANGFNATWRIPNLSRNYPQEWLIDNENKAINPDFTQMLAGVKFQAKTSTGDSNLKSTKQILNTIIPILSILFFSLLVLEFKRNSRSKPKFLHYLVISLPILLTPILLLTLSALTNFDQAYQITAATSITLIFLFVINALKSFTKAFYILSVLATLYAGLYVILRLPEYTLFAFSAGGLWIIILLMMASFNIKEDS